MVRSVGKLFLCANKQVEFCVCVSTWVWDEDLITQPVSCISTYNTFDYNGKIANSYLVISPPSPYCE